MRLSQPVQDALAEAGVGAGLRRHDGSFVKRTIIPGT
jgi:hypothetical protein